MSRGTPTNTLKFLRTENDQQGRCGLRPAYVRRRARGCMMRAKIPVVEWVWDSREPLVRNAQGSNAGSIQALLEYRYM